MKVEISKATDQIYLLPYIKVTYTRNLNGNYELCFGWFNYCLIVSI